MAAVVGWRAARQAARGEKEKEKEKLLPLPSSLLCLLNLVQKELTSKVCAEIHNVRSSGVFHCTPRKRIGRNNIKLRGIFFPVFPPLVKKQVSDGVYATATEKRAAETSATVRSYAAIFSFPEKDLWLFW